MPAGETDFQSENEYRRYRRWQYSLAARSLFMESVPKENEKGRRNKRLISLDFGVWYFARPYFPAIRREWRKSSLVSRGGAVEGGKSIPRTFVMPVILPVAPFSLVATRYFLVTSRTYPTRTEERTLTRAKRQE